MAHIADFQIKTHEGFSIDVYRTSNDLLTIAIHTPAVAMEAIVTLPQARELLEALNQELGA